AWAQMRAVLDISPERLGRWAGGAPWLSRVREVAPRWADELAAGGGGVVRRTAEMMRSLAPLVQAGLDKAVDVLLSGGIDPADSPRRRCLSVPPFSAWPALIRSSGTATSRSSTAPHSESGRKHPMPWPRVSSTPGPSALTDSPERLPS